MNAQELISVLEGRWLGSYGIARCPAHDDRQPSVSVKQTEDGRVLVRCHAGCTQAGVIAALDQRGLWEQHQSGLSGGNSPLRAKHDHAQQEEQRRRRVQLARQVWARSRPAPGTLVEVYLRERG